MGTPPAGWFTSPDDATLQRWWDGMAWTTFTRPVAAVTVPAQRAASPLPVDPDVDERVRDASSGRYQNSGEALDALQHQGGLVGTFAAAAARAIAPPQAPTAPDANGVLPYGRPGFQLPSGTSGFDDGGTSVSWQVGPFSGGRGSDDGADGRRRGGNAGSFAVLLFGLVFLGIGLFAATTMTSGNKVHADESTTIGTVVDRETSIGRRGSRTCSPIASFTVEGSTYRAGSNVSTSDCARIGSAVTVIYTTADPGDGQARVTTSGAFVWLVWLFPLVGLVLSVVAMRALVQTFFRSGSA